MNGRGQSIVLIGMMGAGKSSVGCCLQRRTKLALFDTDDVVASRFGMSIPEVFARHGEGKFRKAETKVLRELTVRKQAIIVTGGGIVSRGENISLLKRLGVVVWLDGNEETLFERVSRGANRPLLNRDDPRKAFAQILHVRLPLYAKIADLRVDTSVLTNEEVGVAILSKLRKVGHNLPRGAMLSTTK